MPRRKSKEEKEKARLEREAQWVAEDRAIKKEIGYVQPASEKTVRRCLNCNAKLKDTAQRCHYCGSTELADVVDALPTFSAVTEMVNGVATCPRCHGTSFKNPSPADLAAGGFVVGGLIGAAVGVAATPTDVVICVTCGMRFKRG